MLPWSEARIPFCKRIPYRNNCVPADAPDHRCVRDAGIRAVTVEQFNMFIEAFNKHLETANIIWGIGDDNESAGNISILIILGYGK